MIDLADKDRPHAYSRQVNDDGRQSAACGICGRHALDPLHLVTDDRSPHDRFGPFGE